MKLVIDSNQLQAEPLRQYLAKSTSNFAVLTDYAAMEAYKGDTLTSMFKSMSILSDLPRQVIVLRGTRAACSMRGRLAGLQRRLVDEMQTSEFPLFVADLRKARAGHQLLQANLLEHGREATLQLDRMLTEAETTGAAFRKFAALHSKDERRAVREGLSYSNEFVQKTMRGILQMAGEMFRQHPNANFVPTSREVPNTFIFRVALCGYLLALDWAANGGADNANPETLRNDIVDVNFAAFATYFDGLMTRDGKGRRIHAEARLWLTALFGCDLPGGLHGCELQDIVHGELG